MTSVHVQHAIARSSRHALAIRAGMIGLMLAAPMAHAQITYLTQERTAEVRAHGEGVDLYTSPYYAPRGTWDDSDQKRTEAGDFGAFSAMLDASGYAPGGNRSSANARLDSSALGADGFTFSSSISAGNTMGNVGSAVGEARTQMQVQFHLEAATDIRLAASASAYFYQGASRASLSLQGPGTAMFLTTALSPSSATPWSLDEILHLAAGTYTLTGLTSAGFNALGGGSGHAQLQVSVLAVPEPATVLTTAMGLLAVAAVTRRRTRG